MFTISKRSESAIRTFYACDAKLYRDVIYCLMRILCDNFDWFHCVDKYEIQIGRSLVLFNFLVAVYAA